jgi:glutathione synthase/RimK-type ligase-like ATP-grasp enzyme
MSGATPDDMPIGIAKLSKLAFDGADLGPLRSQLIDKFIFEPDNAAALMDLATLEQIDGNLADALARQDEALSLRQIYRSPCAAPEPGLRLLAFAAAGDLGANTPLEFLLEGSDIALTTLYVLPGFDLPADIPAHDLAIVAASEGEERRAMLETVARLIPQWPRPVINPPDRIALLARDRLHDLLKGVAGIAMPKTVRIERESLRNLAEGAAPIADFLPEGVFPLILRPVDSHAGRGLAKLDDAAALKAYLKRQLEPAFHLSRFVDYRSADGLFRKYRIVFIDGQAYACHMAISEQWMIYYLNAGMARSAAKRAEEAQFFARFEADFARRHGPALSVLAERVGLDYFGIDCAETPDGELLPFEGDIAMIVHLMDSPAIYPYKVPQMRKVFAAFCALLRQRAALGRAGILAGSAA